MLNEASSPKLRRQRYFEIIVWLLEYYLVILSFMFLCMVSQSLESV